MAIENIVALLVAERDRLNRAIEALEGPAKHHGRSASAAHSPAHAPAKAVAPKKRRHLTPAARKAASERMKAYWAAKRKQKAKS